MLAMVFTFQFVIFLNTRTFFLTIHVNQTIHLIIPLFDGILHGFLQLVQAGGLNAQLFRNNLKVASGKTRVTTLRNISR